MHTGKRPLETGLVVNVACDHLGPECGEGAGFFRVYVPGDGAGGKTTAGIVEDGADQAAALGARGADNCNDFFTHGILGE